MNKTVVHIKGMHCHSCEILIEDELSKIKGVKHVVAKQNKGMAEIFYNDNLDQLSVENAVKEAGYSLGKDDKPLFSKNLNNYLDLIIVGIILFIVYLFADSFGLFNIVNKSANNLSSLPVVFLVGLTAGLSTCMALIGGLVLAASARFAEKHPNATTAQKFKPHLFFNSGRIISYFVLGGIIGYAGSFFQLSPVVLGILTIFVGIVMIFLGLQLIEIFPRLNGINFTLPKSLSRFLGIKNTSAKEYSHKSAAIMGALTFFLPCGFTQAMQLYAISTGKPLTGALTMGVFAIGTAPGLLGVGGLTSVLKGAFARYFFKFAGLIVILLATFNISNGSNLTGFNFLSSSVNTSDTSNSSVILKDGVQIVKMTQSVNGYSPNSFTIKKGIPVKWIINSEDVNTCASTIVSAKLGIKQGLQEGENVIEFTPTEVGIIRFSCIMGMYGGVFNVADETPASQTKNVQSGCNGNQQKTTGSCGAAGGCGCGRTRVNQPSAQTTPEAATQIANAQLIKAIYSLDNDIVPNRFTVKSNQPVRFEIFAKDDGAGCMGSIFIPGLTTRPDIFVKGKTVVFEFTPKPGRYNITCTMGIPRGEIVVN